MNPEVDQYLEVGCGRCPLGGTPECKVHNWTKGLKQLRKIVLDCGLKEEVKWSVPCYTFQGKNILMISALKDYFAISFFKGALLKDTHNQLEKPGKNSQAARLIKFIDDHKPWQEKDILKTYIYQAIEVEKAGLKIDFKAKNELKYPEELSLKFKELPPLQKAFEDLTPGRQRGYILYFSGAKQSKTRTSRIEKYIPKILEGKGFHDR